MKSRVLNFIKNHKFLVAAFVVPFVFMEIVAVVMKIQPFGSNSFMIVDALHQYLPFFSEYQEKLRSADSLFYSFHGGLGYNFLGLWAYYLASPLNFIIILFPKGMLNMVISHLYIIKLALCSLTAAFYFYKRRGKDELSIVAFGVAYAFSSYMVGYSWNIMWVEVMMMLPVVLYGFEKLMKEGDGRVYSGALFIALLCNFYMSFMMCLFLVLWFILYEHEGVRKFFQNGIRFALFSLLSGAMAACTLIPAYLGIMQTSSAKLEFPKELWYGTFGNIFQRHFLGTKPLTMAVDDSEINLYCGILTLLLVGFYIASKEIPKLVRIKRLFLVVILFLSFNMPVLGYIWHGFHDQYGIPNRFAFLYIFLLLSLAYDGYCLLMEHGKMQVWKIYFALSLLCVLCGISVYTLTKTVDSTYLYVTIGVAVVYVLQFFLYEKGYVTKKFFTIALCGVFIIETGYMAGTGFKSTGTVDTAHYFKDTEAIQTLKDRNVKGLFDRTEIVSWKMLDESIWHTLNGVTMFGSTAQGKMVDIMDRLGFYTGVNEYLYEGATPFTNNLLSVKYQLYRTDDKRLSNFKKADKEKDVTLYKNPYETGLGYGMNSDVKICNFNSVNPFEVQNNLVQKAYGTKDLFHMVGTQTPTLSGVKITSSNGGGEYVFENTTSVDDNMVFTITSEEEREMFVHFDGSQVENTVIEKNGTVIGTGRLDAQILSLGKMKKGDNVRISMKLKQDDVMSGVVRLTAAYMDTDVMDQVYKSMKSQMFQTTEESSTHIEGTVSLDKDGTVFFSMPYDKGWKVEVDGKEAKTHAIGEAFLGVDTTKGKHTITLKYTPPGFLPGVLLTVVGFVIFVAICLNYRKEKISKSKKNITG